MDHHQPVYQHTNASGGIRLTIKQQPRIGLVAIPGKEKFRKPIDPPPVIRLDVDPSIDRDQTFMVNPYYICVASLKSAESSAPPPSNTLLAGSNSSSVSKLKDTTDQYGAYFTFGDLSIKATGTYRLTFHLYELQKDTHDVQYITRVDSDPFRIVAAKDFPGMAATTFLTHTFQGQGVKLRIRKEPRGRKRSLEAEDDLPDPPMKHSRLQPPLPVTTPSHMMTPSVPSMPSISSMSSLPPSWQTMPMPMQPSLLDQRSLGMMMGYSDVPAQQTSSLPWDYSLNDTEYRLPRGSRPT